MPGGRPSMASGRVRRTSRHARTASILPPSAALDTTPVRHRVPPGGDQRYVRAPAVVWSGGILDQTLRQRTMIILRLLLILIVSPFLLLARLAGFRRTPMAYLPDDHPEMAAAIASARATLSEFRRRLAAPEPGMANFGIKARFPVTGGAEHLWIGDLQANGSGFVGKVTVHPQEVVGLQLGSGVEVTEDMITDWSYSQNGVFRGHHTTRVLLPLMSPKVRDRVLAIYGWSGKERQGAPSPNAR